MAFKIEDKGTVLVIHCPKDIDVLMGKQISIQQAKWIASAKETLALNLSQVESIDVEGFRALSLLARATKSADKKFVSVNPKKGILSEIRKQGLDSVLNPIQAPSK